MMSETLAMILPNTAAAAAAFPLNNDSAEVN
jgi:hypothetical protein